MTSARVRRELAAVCLFGLLSASAGIVVGNAILPETLVTSALERMVR